MKNKKFIDKSGGGCTVISVILLDYISINVNKHYLIEREWARGWV